MKNGKIGVTTENIFPVIKKFLYSDHEIFLRELISNAVDATQKLKTLSSIGEVKGELGDLTIHVAVDPQKKTLTVTDRGIGMTAEEVDKYITWGIEDGIVCASFIAGIALAGWVFHILFTALGVA